MSEDEQERVSKKQPGIRTTLCIARTGEPLADRIHTNQTRKRKENRERKEGDGTERNIDQTKLWLEGENVQMVIEGLKVNRVDIRHKDKRQDRIRRR